MSVLRDPRSYLVTCEHLLVFVGIDIKKSVLVFYLTVFKI